MKIGMECLSFLIITGLLFNVATATEKRLENCASDPSKYRLPVTTKCLHYNVELTFRSIKLRDTFDFYKGTGSYIIAIDQPTKDISLHTYQMIDTTITKLTSHWNSKVYMAMEHILCQTTNILTIGFDVELPPANYTLDIGFADQLSFYNVTGFSKLVYLKNDTSLKSFLTTTFLWDARKLFPCWDEPAQRATFNISVKHPPSYTVLSNMPVREQRLEHEMMWTHFHTTPLIPPHLVGIVMSDDLVCISNSDNSTNVCGRQEVIKDLKVAYDIVQQLSLSIKKYININVTVSKVDHIVIPPSKLQSKHSWGLYTYE